MAIAYFVITVISMLAIAYFVTMAVTKYQTPNNNECLIAVNKNNSELKQKIEQMETEYSTLYNLNRNRIKHAKILAAIHAEQKAHVKALFNVWQVSKKGIAHCRPGSKEEATKKRATQKARTEWKLANAHYLKHFGDYAP